MTVLMSIGKEAFHHIIFKNPLDIGVMFMYNIIIRTYI